MPQIFSPPLSFTTWRGGHFELRIPSTKAPINGAAAVAPLKGLQYCLLVQREKKEYRARVEVVGTVVNIINPGSMVMELLISRVYRTI